MSSEDIFSSWSWVATRPTVQEVAYWTWTWLSEEECTWSSNPAILNLLWLADHLLNFVAVHRPPLKIFPLVHCGWS